MDIGKIMADLLKYTKKIANKINYYDAIIDFADESHWLNPFYSHSEMIVIWSDKSENNNFMDYT